MKKLYLFYAILLIFSTIQGYSQIYFIHESEHYHIASDISEEYSKGIADKMEAALQLFNEVFHFDLEDLSIKLKATIFKDKSSFKDYLTVIIDETREDFTYIHYTDQAKCELVGFIKENEEELNSSLLHQGFIQYIKTFIAEPPIWLREGAAIYFEKSIWDNDSKTFTFKSNMVWLNSLKSMMKGLEDQSIIPINTLILMNKTSVANQIDIFYPQSWGLVAFLIESKEKKYNRIFWDAITALDPLKNLEENSREVKKKAFDWLYTPALENDFITYILSLKTYNELVSEGIDLYVQQDYKPAYENFVKAAELKSEEYIPYYYLGLISYAQKDYIRAEGYYNTALSLGAEKSLIFYALGVNAFANNQYDKAINYLLEAKKENPENYTAKVDALLIRIEPLR